MENEDYVDATERIFSPLAQKVIGVYDRKGRAIPEDTVTLHFQNTDKSVNNKMVVLKKRSFLGLGKADSTAAPGYISLYATMLPTSFDATMHNYQLLITVIDSDRFDYWIYEGEFDNDDPNSSLPDITDLPQIYDVFLTMLNAPLTLNNQALPDPRLGGAASLLN